MYSGIKTRVDGVGGSSLAAGAESPPGARPTSTSDLDLSVCGVVCPSPMAKLVVAPTLAVSGPSWSVRDQQDVQ